MIALGGLFLPWWVKNKGSVRAVDFYPNSFQPNKKPSNRYGSRVISGRGGQIRTDDFLLPKQALYQAELRPERGSDSDRNLLIWQDNFWSFSKKS